jgi:hypothetical protein
MRVPTNTLNPLILLWSAVYVSALLSLYTFAAGILARRSPAKSIRNHLGLKP